MELLFYLISVVLVVASIGVVLFKNPIYSALALVANLVSVAALFAMLDAHFLAVVQIVVYAGAIMVLVMFVLMLLNAKIENENRNTALYMVAVLIAGVVFTGLLSSQILTAFDPAGLQQMALVLDGGVAAMGRQLYTRFVFPFEAASVLILVAMVGAVVLAKRKIQQRQA